MNWLNHDVYALRETLPAEQDLTTRFPVGKDL